MLLILHWMGKRVVHAPLMIFAICLGAIAALGVLSMSPNLHVLQLIDRPQYVGRLNGMDIYYSVGDVIIPNQVTTVTNGQLQLSHRLKHWDSCLITAPVPSVTSLGSDIQVVIPWTLLPLSVVESAGLIDTDFAASLKHALAIKKDWQFEGLARIEVPRDSRFATVTGMRSVYAVNMFDFLSDLGTDYRHSLRNAISRSVMEAVQQSGADSSMSLSIPALAAADNVADKELVLTYEESFDSILDGLDRARGRLPGKIYLVVWWRFMDLEAASAKSGLRTALYSRVPHWRDSLTKALTAATAIAFVLGVLLSIVRREPTAFKSQWFRIVILSLATFSAAAGATLVQWSTHMPWLSHYPAFVVGVITAVAFVLGSIVERFMPGQAGVHVAAQQPTHG